MSRQPFDGGFASDREHAAVDARQNRPAGRASETSGVSSRSKYIAGQWYWSSVRSGATCRGAAIRALRSFDCLSWKQLCNSRF